MAEYARTVISRKARWCDDPFDGPHRIPAGAPYARCVAFPGSEANEDGTRPYVVHLCSDCYCRYGKPMPPIKNQPENP